LASAKAAATRKDFAEALRSTKEAVKLRPDSDVRAQAADVVKGFSADATTAGAEIVNVQDPSAMNAVSVLKSWVAVLEETVPYHPDQAPTLATAKAKLAEAKGIEQAREEAQSREREAAAAVARAAEQKARADRSRTFSLVGAIVSWRNSESARAPCEDRELAYASMDGYDMAGHRHSANEGQGYAGRQGPAVG
jgi:hypothetical protein